MLVPSPGAVDSRMVGDLRLPTSAVFNDDVLDRFRLRLFSLAEEGGNVRAACR
jgi:hypothetical protein